MGKINSRDKGARAEREFARYLTDAGYPAYRGQQFSGGKDSPDVKFEEYDGHFPMHFEVKHVEKLNLRDAMTQAKRDCPDFLLPAVAHRRNHDTWKVTMEAGDFFKLLRLQ